MAEVLSKPSTFVKVNKKGQSGGLVSGLIMGIAALIIVIIITLLVISSLNNANLFNPQTTTIVNETNGFINETGYTLDVVNTDTNFPRSFSIVYAANNSEIIAAPNYTLSSSGVVTNATAVVWNDEVNFTYTYESNDNEEQSVDLLRGNFSAGIDNISEQVPTILLIAAIVLLVGLLAVLVGVWQRMRLGGNSI